MQEQCHRCGGELPAGSGESPFCPHCGAPQLTLSLENQSVPAATEADAAAATTAAGAAPVVRPRGVDWRIALRCAALVAGIGAVLALASLRANVLQPVTSLWAVSGSMVALGLYQRQRPAAWMDARVGARIGVVVGLCLALALIAALAASGLLERFVLHRMGGFDTTLTARLADAQRQAQQWMAAQSVPMTPDIAAFEQSPEFRAGLVLSYCVMGGTVLLAVSALGGAFAGLLRTRKGA